MSGACRARPCSLGPNPSLHRLRRRSPALVRRLRRYYGWSDFSASCINRLRSSDLPDAGRRAKATTVEPEISRFRAKSFGACWGLRPRRAGRALASRARPSCLPPRQQRRRPELTTFRGSIPSLLPPCQRFTRASRRTAHDSGPAWRARPSLYGTCTRCSLPVSRRTVFVVHLNDGRPNRRRWRIRHDLVDRCARGRHRCLRGRRDHQGLRRRRPRAASGERRRRGGDAVLHQPDARHARPAAAARGRRGGGRARNPRRRRRGAGDPSVFISSTPPGAAPRIPGRAAVAWCGHRLGDGFSVAGNCWPGPMSSAPPSPATRRGPQELRRAPASTRSTPARRRAATSAAASPRR